MFLCIWAYGNITLFHSFFYESISLKKEHLKLMHLFLANQGQKSFFLWSVKCLYIFYSPFIKRKRSSKFPIGSARHFFNVFAQWCLEIMYRPVAKKFVWTIIIYHVWVKKPVKALGFQHLNKFTLVVWGIQRWLQNTHRFWIKISSLIFSMKYIKFYAISRPKLTFECYLKFEFTFYALKPENFAFYLT